MSEGFSAFIPSLSSISASTQLTGWTVASPYFSSASFNASSGVYTVPATGRYSVQATINYSTTAAITVSLGASINPTFIVQRINTSTNLIAGLFPIMNFNVTILTLRAILGSGTVTLAGEVTLNIGDTIGLFYNAGGLTISLNLGGSTAPGIVWSMTRLT